MDTTRATLVDISSSDLYNSLLTNIAANNKRFMDRSYDSLSRQQKDTVAREQGMIKERDYTVVSIPLRSKSTAADNNALRLYLRTILSRMMDSETVNTVLSQENMQQYWIPAFTHRSYDPTPNRNYEKLEYWGDSALKLSFRNYLALNYPDFNESELSNLSNHYMSTEEQASLADSLGLPKHLRSYVPVTRGIQEDLLESFYGALYSIGGMDLVNSVTAYLYKGVYIDQQYKLGSFTTRVQQALQAIGLTRPKEGFITGRGTVTAYLYYDDEESVQTLKNRFNIPYRRTTVRRTPEGEVTGYSIATATGRFKGMASANAYQNLSRLFDTRGVYDAVRTRRTSGIDELLRYVQENIDPSYESVSVYRQTGDYEVTAVLQGTIGPISNTIYAVTISYDFGRAPREREIYSLLLDSMRRTAPRSRGTAPTTDPRTRTRQGLTTPRTRGQTTTVGTSTAPQQTSTVTEEEIDDEVIVTIPQLEEEGQEGRGTRTRLGTVRDRRQEGTQRTSTTGRGGRTSGRGSRLSTRSGTGQQRTTTTTGTGDRTSGRFRSRRYG